MNIFMYCDIYGLNIITRHEFVKALKRKLDETLSPLINEEPERNSIAGHADNHESRVNNIIDHILQSRE